MKNILFAFSATLLLLSSSCTKEIDDQEIDVSKPTYLTENYWKLTSLVQNLTYGQENSSDVEIFTFLDDCIKDDIYTFESTSVFSVAEHHMKCNANNPEKTDYYYNITNNDGYIKIWSNPEDIDNSVYMQGEITTISINKFTIKTLQYIEQDDRTEMKLYTYEVHMKKPKK